MVDAGGQGINVSAWVSELGAKHQLTDVAMTHKWRSQEQPKSNQCREKSHEESCRTESELVEGQQRSVEAHGVAGGSGGGVLLLADQRSLKAAIFVSARIDCLLLAFFFGRVQCLCLMGTTGVNWCAQCSESLS